MAGIRLWNVGAAVSGDLRTGPSRPVAADSGSYKKRRKPGAVNQTCPLYFT